MPEKVTIDKRINPQVKDAEIGVRGLRDIKIYPLSMSDQFKMTDLITQAISGFFAAQEAATDVAFVAFVVNLIKDNFTKILNMVTDESGEKLIEDLTNNQAAIIVEIIYDENFGSVVKNSESLIGKIKNLFPSMGQSPQSAKPMGGTGSKISSKKPIKKVVQRMGK